MTASEGFRAGARRAATIMGFVAATLVASAAASAAEAEQGGGVADNSATLDEITVTATRRGDQSLQNIPLAVDAYSGATLEKFSVDSMLDISKIDPSLNVQSYGATQQQLIIRGVASSIGQTTGIYLNEAPLQGGANSDVFGDGTPGLRLHDIDHIEVLKGPQGTLFGAGSMDGTLRVVTNKPDLLHFGGSIEASGAGIDGGNALYKGDAVFNAPIIPGKLGARAVFWDESGGGFIDQTINAVTRSNVNDVHLYGGRVTLLWVPIDALSVTASWNYQRTGVGGSQEWTEYVGSTSAYPAPPLGPFSAYNNHSPTQEPYNQNYRLFDLTAQYDLGFGSITAASSYGQKHDVQPKDSSPTGCSFTCALGFSSPTSYIPAIQFSDLTGELRFSSKFQGPFQLVAGTFYEQDRTVNTSAAIVTPADGSLPCLYYWQCQGAGLVQPGQGNSVLEFATLSHFNVNQYAAYAQGDYKILDNLTATAGVRYFAARIHQTDYQEQNIAPTMTPYGFDGGYALGEITTPYMTADDHGTNSKTTYNAALLWALTPDLSLYARAASGFRIGGLNDASGLAAQAGVFVPNTYNPDSLWDYEAGVKVYFLDHKLYLDATYYHIDWSNQQTDVQAHGTFNYTLNVGKTVTDGFEMSSSYRPFPGLTLAANVNYVDARLGADLPDSAEALGNPGHSADRVPLVPHWSYSGQADYERPLAGDVRGYVSADFTYRGSSFTAFEPGGSSVYLNLPSYYLVDMALGTRFSRYDVGLFVRNVTNKVAFVGLQPDYDSYRVYSPPPRTIGVRFSAYF